MNPGDINTIVDSVLSTLGHRASASDVEAAAVQVLEAVDSPSMSGSPLIWIRFSVSVAACASRRSATQRARVYDHLRLASSSLALLVEDVARDMKAPLPHIELNVRDSSSLLYGHGKSELLSIAEAMARAATDTGVSIVRGPFLDLALEQNASLLGVLPELLAISPVLRPVVQLGTKENGFDSDTSAALSLALSIHNKAQHLRGTGSPQCTIVVNGCDRRAFETRVHPEQNMVSVLAEDFQDVEWASAFATQLEESAAIRAENFEVCRLELSTSNEDGAVQTGSISTESRASGSASKWEIKHSVDGLPGIGPFRNKVAIPSGFDPSDLDTFCKERLLGLTVSGIHAGIHVDFPRS